MALQDYDVFSRCHPAVNFLFFVAAIVLTVVLFHPAYLLVSLLCGAGYYAVLRRKRCGKTFLFLLCAMVLVAAVNPLFNTLGQTQLFTLFGRPYTWEALCYGGCTGLMFAAVSLWFLCGGIVMTSDKFTSLFGAVIPAISLVLVMVLRLVPAYWRKGRQIAGARRCIGRSAGSVRLGAGGQRGDGGLYALSRLRERKKAHHVSALPLHRPRCRADSGHCPAAGGGDLCGRVRLRRSGLYSGTLHCAR